MRSFLTVMLLLLLASCAIIGKQKKGEDWLPEAAGLPCCWQIEENLQLNRGNQDPMYLHAVVVMDGDKLSIVLMTGLANRLLTLLQQGTEITRLEGVEKMPDFPVKLFLMGIYLKHLPEAYWENNELDWQYQQLNNRKTLSRSGETWLSMTEINNRQSEIFYPGSGIQVVVTELSRKSF